MNIILRLAALCKFELLIHSQKILLISFAASLLLTLSKISTFRREPAGRRTSVSTEQVAARLERQRQADNSYNIAPVKAGTAPCVWGRRRECWQQPFKTTLIETCAKKEKLTNSSRWHPLRHANLCGGKGGARFTWLAQARSAHPFLFFLPVK